MLCPPGRQRETAPCSTSRPYGLDEAGLARLRLPRAPLEPLPGPLQELFVTRWFHTLRREELGGDLLEAMRGRDDLAPLSENPMLLTAMCVLYDKGGRLPEDRYELYKSIVDGVLHSRYPGDAREREPVLRRLEAIAYGMHTGEPGDAPRQTPAAEISWVETERLLAHFAENNPSLGQGEVAAAVQREELLTRSGLLLPRPNERAAFYHLSFQEFLAAQRIARGSEKRVSRSSMRVGRSRNGARPCCFCSPLRSSTGTPSGGSTFSRGCLRARTAPRSKPTRRRRCSSPRRSSCAWPSAIRSPRLWPRASAGSAWTPSRTRSRCRRGRRWACAWAGWATRAFSTCAIPAPTSRCRPGPIPMASRRARRSRSRRRSCSAAIRSRTASTGPLWRTAVTTGMVVGRRLELAAEGGGHRAATLAGPALEWPQPAGGRRQLLGGRGLLRLGRRAPAARAGMGGRRPRPERLRVPLVRRLGGRDLQHPRGPGSA